ncbi:hypothetical protein [Rheinheimera soli]|uniref:Uncharacterized protein n=1 Tax=Rheinheimera soli TaxID=443616 RepID=A0ABU1VWD7_9GAMM|nr:hypothetical protein [Rheinheimera soli]MDR7120012.1 hypothetical protein [Rheinheimera soli]
MYISPGLVVGFHGCDKSVFDGVVKNGEVLGSSENAYDWLGHGIYFWEGSYERALEWAKDSNKVKTPAVIGAFIKLGYCIDLLDSADVAKVKKAYEILKLELQTINKTLPVNQIVQDGINMVRELDCKVMMHLQQINNEAIAKELGLADTSGTNIRKIRNHQSFIDSVRGMFPEGKDLYPNAGFREKNHIQLCIVNPNCILGYFDPRQRNVNYKKIV